MLDELKKFESDDPDSYYEAGNKCLVRNRLNEAVAFYQKVLQLNPRHSDAYYNLGLAFQRKGGLSEAISCYQKVTSLNPDSADAYNNLGIILRKKGKLHRAGLCFQKALQIKPDCPEVYVNLGNTYQYYSNMSNDYAILDDAILCYEKAIEIKPDYASAFFNMGVCYYRKNKVEKAITCYLRAIRFKPTYPRAYDYMATAMATSGRTEEALEFYNKAIEQDPNYANAYSGLATLLEHLNRIEEADKIIRSAVRLDPESHTVKRTLARLKYRQGDYVAARDLLEEVAQDTSHGLYSCSLNLLGKAYDKLGDYNAAFRTFEESNKHSSMSIEAEIFNKQSRALPQQFRKLKECCTEKSIHAWDDYVPDDSLPRPIFLVGFPRSGTTLLDQMLNTHSAIITLEEKPTMTGFIGNILSHSDIQSALSILSGKEIRCFRKMYWDNVSTLIRGEINDRIIIDKMPLNITLLSLIYRVFPEAKIIVALRDPRDVVMSNFMQKFTLNENMMHSLTIEGAANYYALVMDLYLQYRKVLPVKMFEIHYEAIVSNMKHEITKLLEFLGVAWEDGILKYYEAAKQRHISTPSYSGVVKPVYKESISRWKNYTKQLEAVLPLLDEFVVLFGYDLDEP